jgi:hypothetical protein
MADKAGGRRIIALCCVIGAAKTREEADFFRGSAACGVAWAAAEWESGAISGLPPAVEPIRAARCRIPSAGGHEPVRPQWGAASVP